jgi:hypothetical protein
MAFGEGSVCKEVSYILKIKKKVNLNPFPECLKIMSKTARTRPEQQQM